MQHQPPLLHDATMPIPRFDPAQLYASLP